MIQPKWGEKLNVAPMTHGFGNLAALKNRNWHPEASGVKRGLETNGTCAKDSHSRRSATSTQWVAVAGSAPEAGNTVG